MVRSGPLSTTHTNIRYTQGPDLLAGRQGVPGERRKPAHKGRLIINYTASRMHSRDFFSLALPAPGCSGESEYPIVRTLNLLKSSSYGHHTDLLQNYRVQVNFH